MLKIAMPIAAAVPVFLISLGVTLTAARTLARRLDWLGVRFDFPESLVGLLTAVAADGPEISSALVALAKGDRGISVGVLVGSGAFNLAAMIGLTGLLAGAVQLARATLLLEGLIAVVITLIAGAVLMQWLAVPIAVGLAAVAIAAYLALVIGGYELLEHRAIPQRLTDRLSRALVARVPHHGAPAEPANPTRHLLGLAVLDLALIIAGSFGMVQAAVALGDRLDVSRAVLGVLVLAPLTSIPNAVTGVRLGLAGRGAALVGETFNSNTINLAAGVIVPAIFTSAVVLDTTAKLQLAWLVAMTLACLAMLAARGGLRRVGGAALIGMYGGFVATQLV